MCGSFYYEFSKLLSRFNENLASKKASFNRSKLMSYMKAHAALYNLVHNLQGAISSPCFYLLCTQMMNLFSFIAVFELRKVQSVTYGSICSVVLILVLVALSVIGTVLCASRINTQYKKIATTLTLLKDAQIMQSRRDPVVISCLNSMKEKQFPVMSANGVVELTPSLAFGMFGSLFSYSLLILNLKNWVQ
ncbi:hypothetical protein AVEN_248710-1 [Araneus ventricosus]|uniref:Gustatory receptor 28b n=1 Tax=Araneus ventricosus TaxID=182803 RepID=A0A4Y2PEC1_ARAVE|nr:hypothetical protein AVEN_248710-1 [Araneus ventricosus]